MSADVATYASNRLDRMMDKRSQPKAYLPRVISGNTSIFDKDVILHQLLAVMLFMSKPKQFHPQLLNEPHHEFTHDSLLPKFLMTNVRNSSNSV